VPRRVEAGDVCQQNLSSADVGGRLFATDVLLAGLQGEAHGRPTLGVGADSHQPTGKGAGNRLIGGDERGVRSSEAHRHAKALCRADRNVGMQLCRRNCENARHEVSRNDCQAVDLVHRRDRLRPIGDRTTGCRQAEQGAEAAMGNLVDIADDQLDSDGLSTRCQDCDRLRMRVVMHHKPGAVGLRQPPCHGHRFRRGSGLVEQRGVGQIEAGELGHHRLKVEQRLEPALADLGLVGRVGRVPRRILEHVTNDYRGSDGAVVAHSDQTGSRLIPRRQ
jgi:hypothetical protein